jgi:CrcB protein
LTVLLVALGAALGAPSRWWLDRWVQQRITGVFPWGTLAVNVSGSFLLGVLLGAAADGHAGQGSVALLGVGYCGGYTTFSTVGFEVTRLVEDGSYLEAALDAVTSMAVGLAAAFAGWYLGRLL